VCVCEGRTKKRRARRVGAIGKRDLAESVRAAGMDNDFNKRSTYSRSSRIEKKESMSLSCERV
jgi:hypothetical protein